MRFMQVGILKSCKGKWMSCRDLPYFLQQSYCVLGNFRLSSSSERAGWSDDEDDSCSSCSSVSELSGLSELSGRGWRPLPAALARARLGGADPRAVLARLTGEHLSFAQDVPESAIWSVIISYLTEHPRRKRLSDVSSIQDVIRLLKTCKKIMVLTGAGVSVSCGIPDFRSRDGVYARLAQDFPDLPDPQAMFDIYYFRQNPRPFFKFAKEIFPGQFTPSPGHRFIKMLEKHKKLLRNYTQNIDTLEKQAGIENVIECHGSFATASCTKCRRQVPGEAVRDAVLEQRLPTCDDCGPAGIMKPDIVFFGEGLPESFHDALAADKDSADLLIVIGSSLKVRPVALIPHSLPSSVPQILINRERLPHLDFDVELLGDCDVVLDHLCHLLGPGWEEVRWRSGPLPEAPPSPSAANHLEDEDEEEEHEVKCQRIGKRQGAGGREEEGGVRHTSLDSSRDSGIGEASDPSPLAQPACAAPPDDDAAAPAPCQTAAPPPAQQAPCPDSRTTPPVPKDSYYRLGKRRYIFPGAELSSPDDSN